MAQPYRLADKGRLDRSKPLTFVYDGDVYQGFEGDTLASALLANGVKLVGRSFKYHRPRGIMGAGAEEANALVQLGEGGYSEPNTRATVVELYDGLVGASQNCWPSVKFDIQSINQKLAKFFPAGFYYKTFMFPASWWTPVYEKIIRQAAGLGKSPIERDPDSYAQKFAHCDILVVGGGPAGLAAALTAGRSGARVILVDEQNEFGGSLLSDDASIDGSPALDWVAATVAELQALPEVTVLPRTTLSGYFDYNYLTALERVTDHLGPQESDAVPRQRFWKIRAKKVVLAQGSIERPLVFTDNDRPGIMLASAVRTYINRYGVLPGRQMVVFTNNDSAYRTALDAFEAGGSVEVVDMRPDPTGPLVKLAEDAGIRVHKGMAVVATFGKHAVNGCEIATLSEDGRGIVGGTTFIGCDLIANSNGWNPTVHLWSQARGKLTWDEEKVCFVPGFDGPWKPLSAGASNGSFALGDCLKEGFSAGQAAAQAVGFSVDSPSVPVTEDVEEEPARMVWTVPGKKPLGHGKAKHFHDFQNDVVAADIHLAAREGYLSVEHLKRYTTTGMATDQGKTSNVNALAIMAEIRNASIPEVGTTTFRPPYTPITFGAVTGQNRNELFLQKRTTAMHKAHVEAGAVFEDVGDWKRPWYFPKPGEDMDAAVLRECRMVRETVGMMDASTLGKIDVQGKDAAEFLNWVYTNKWDTLKVGRARYGLMLNEHGMVFDDGVTTRLADDHFHMTTTTGGAARVLGWLEEWSQTEWPQMDVHFTSVTEQWAVCTLSGPRARALLSGVTDLDLDPENFPFLSMQEGTVAGVPARVYRISFTGDLAFEVNVPARYGLHVWNALREEGKNHDLCLYGTETMHVLRAEKGFIIVGQDTDGTVTPMDLGMDWIVSKKKKDFLGRRSFARSDTARPGRKQLVGLLTKDPNFVLPEGAHLVEEVLPKPPMKTLGHVTSSYFSPNVGRSIAMALVADGFARKGSTLQVPMMSGRVETVTITDPVFYDEKGARTDG